MVFSPSPSFLMNSCEPFLCSQGLGPSMIEKKDSKQENSQQISNFVPVKLLEGLEEARILELFQVGIINISSVMRNYQETLNIFLSIFPPSCPPAPCMLVILKNEHKKKLLSRNYTVVSESARITAALTSRDFSYYLFQNLAESFSLVRALIFVGTVASFMKSVKM